MKTKKRFAAIVLSLLMIMTMMPAMAFADEPYEEPGAETYDETIGSEDEEDMGYGEGEISESIDPEALDELEVEAEPEALMDEFFLSDTPAETEQTSLQKPL